MWEFLKEKAVANTRDPRLSASFLYDSTDVRGPKSTVFYGKPFESLNYSTNPNAVPNTNDVYMRKFLSDATRDGEVFHSGNNYRYLRYADVLMLYAEALNAQGQTTKAYSFIDRVRQRTGLAALTTAMPGLSQAAFLTQLKHERITELSCEGHRWEDLARWGDLGPQLAPVDGGFSNFVKGKHELLPVIQFDLDVNPYLKQNAGWN